MAKPVILDFSYNPNPAVLNSPLTFSLEVRTFERSDLLIRYRITDDTDHHFCAGIKGKSIEYLKQKVNINKYKFDNDVKICCPNNQVNPILVITVTNPATSETDTTYETIDFA